MPEPYTIVYIAGVGHCGSTLLDLILSSHSHVAGMGEIKVLSKRVSARQAAHFPRWGITGPLDRTCACGVRPISSCEFWKAVDERMRHDAGLRLTELDLYNDDESTFVAHNRAVLRAIQAVTGRRFIVDLSKSLSRLRRLVGSGVFDVRPIHVVRHPLGVVYSMLKRERTLVQCATTYTASVQATRHYLRKREHLEMSYEALATSPWREVARAVEWLGLDFEPGQMDWAGKEHHHIQGNHLRRDRDGRISLDRRWETGLNAWQKLCVRTLTLPTLLFPGAREDATDSHQRLPSQRHARGLHTASARAGAGCVRQVVQKGCHG